MSSFQQPINHKKHNFYHHYAALYMNCQLLIKSFRFIHIEKGQNRRPLAWLHGNFTPAWFSFGPILKVFYQAEGVQIKTVSLYQGILHTAVHASILQGEADTFYAVKPVCRDCLV